MNRFYCDCLSNPGLHPDRFFTQVKSTRFFSHTVIKNFFSSIFHNEKLTVNVKKSSGAVDVLRACLPRSRGVFKTVCSDFASKQAHGTWCVCDRDLCNGAPTNVLSTVGFLVVLIAVFEATFVI